MYLSERDRFVMVAAIAAGVFVDVIFQVNVRVDGTVVFLWVMCKGLVSRAVDCVA